MRSREWLWLAAGLAFSACSGDYPLEPTACDSYCHATKDLQCDSYDPAACVTQCERDHKGDDRCRAYLDALVSCLESNPGAIEAACNPYGFFSPSESTPCSNELTVFVNCTFPY